MRVHWAKVLLREKMGAASDLCSRYLCDKSIAFHSLYVLYALRYEVDPLH